MADEYQIAWIGAETLIDGPSDVRVYHVSAEVPHTGILSPPLMIYHISVEVLRSTTVLFSPEFIDDSDLTVDGDFGLPRYHEDFEDFYPVFVDDAGEEFLNPSFQQTNVPVVAAEWNPYRPDIPESISRQDPTMYDYLREQAELVRDQHNLTQAGDTTYPWEMAAKPGERKSHTLGSLTRFFHEDYGLLQARYVQFSDNWLSQFHMFVGHDSTRDEWIVTNDNRKVNDWRVIGLALPFESGLSGLFGWVMTNGRAPVAIKMTQSTRPAAYQRLTWTNDGTGFVEAAAGPAVGMILNDLDITEILTGGGGSFDPRQWRIPAGDWLVDVSGYTPDYITELAAAEVVDVTLRVTLIEQQLADTQFDYSGDILALQNDVTNLQTNLLAESRARTRVDTGYQRRLLDLEAFMLAGGGSGTVSGDVTALRARVEELEGVVSTKVTDYDAKWATYFVWKGATDARLNSLESNVALISGMATDWRNITAMLDYDNTTPATDGQVIVWDNTLARFKPSTLPTLEVMDASVSVDAATTRLNFVGAGVSASQTAPGQVQITIAGGGGGGGAFQPAAHTLCGGI